MTQNITSMNTDCKKTVKADIICGFRGSGKTTLITKMAKEIWEGELVVFLQNKSGRETLSREALPSGCHVRMMQSSSSAAAAVSFSPMPFYKP